MNDQNVWILKTKYRIHGRYKSWTIKKAEHRIDAFELWCWKRLLRVPWTARRSNQSNLKEISPGCSLEGWMLKLKLQYFGRLMRRADSLEKTLMLGKIEGRRRWGLQRMRWLDGIPTQRTWVWASSRRWWRTGKPGVLWFMGSQEIGQNWTELSKDYITIMYPAWGQFLLPENFLANPVILKCKLWEWS